MYSGSALLPTPLATTRRLLLPVLVVLAIPFEAATKDLVPPPSVSCLDADGEKCLQGLLDRIHQLEVLLDAEMEARLTERAEAARNMQGVANELTQQAATALDPPKQPTKVDAFDLEQARKELVSLKAALDEETAARRRAEAETTAASKTTTTLAHAVQELEQRLAVAEKRAAPAVVAPEESDAETPVATNPDAPPAPEPSPQVQVAEPAPTTTPAALSEGERVAAQPRAASTRCDEPLETSPIAPGDKVSIQVEHLEEVSRTVQVANDGQVDLPLLGRVPVAGRNQHELVANLEQRLRLYLQAPRVEVALQRDCGR
jgi:hypothetical protein